MTLALAETLNRLHEQSAKSLTRLERREAAEMRKFVRGAVWAEGPSAVADEVEVKGVVQNFRDIRLGWHFATEEARMTHFWSVGVHHR